MICCVSSTVIVNIMINKLNFYVQVTPLPNGLVGLLSDLFVEQEKARCQLRMQHIKERV